MRQDSARSTLNTARVVGIRWVGRLSVWLVVAVTLSVWADDTRGPKGSGAVSVLDGQVVVQAENIALEDLLLAIGRATGIDIRISAPGATRLLDASFSLSPEEAIRFLLEGASFVLEHDASAEGRLKRVFLMSTGNAWSNKRLQPRVTRQPKPPTPRANERNPFEKPMPVIENPFEAVLEDSPDRELLKLPERNPQGAE